MCARVVHFFAISLALVVESLLCPSQLLTPVLALIIVVRHEQ